MSSGNTTAPSEHRDRYTPLPKPFVLTLTIVNSRDEPERRGESVALSGTGWVFLGRGDSVQHATFGHRRPGLWLPRGSLVGATISRNHVGINIDDTVTFEVMGKNEPVRLNGLPVTEGTLKVDDILEIGDLYMFLVTMGPADQMDPYEYWALPPHPFGGPDKLAMVGESGVMRALRDRIAQCALSTEAVLITGESGTGKELIARGIHRLSDRRDRPFEAYNCASLTPEMAAAELFGNDKNATDGHMPARKGIIERAAGGIVFLDEIAEAPTAIQTKLNRAVLYGEIAPVGAAKTRHVDVRYLGATNRDINDPMVMKFDLVGRMPERMRAPPLASRREDIVLILQDIVRTLAAKSPQAPANAFLVPNARGLAHVRIDPTFLRALLHQDYLTNINELRVFALASIAQHAKLGVLCMPTEEPTLVWRRRAVAAPPSSYEMLQAEVDRLGIVEAARRHGTDRWKHGRFIKELREALEEGDPKK